MVPWNYSSSATAGCNFLGKTWKTVKCIGPGAHQAMASWLDRKIRRPAIVAEKNENQSQPANRARHQPKNRASKRFLRSISLAVFRLSLHIFWLLRSLVDHTLGAFIACRVSGPSQFLVSQWERAWLYSSTHTTCYVFLLFVYRQNSYRYADLRPITDINVH